MADSSVRVSGLTAISRYLSWPVIVVVLWSLLIPAAGIPLFFRNEAGDHLAQIHNNSFGEVLEQRWRSTNFRPAAYFVWWLIDRLFGLSSTAYLCANAVFYVISMLMLYKLARRLWGITGGLGAVCAYQVTCFFLQYSLYNAVYGIFYPMLMTFLLGAVWQFIKITEGDGGKISFPVFCALALLTHSYAVVLLPTICFAIALFPPVKPSVELRRRILGCALLAALCAAVFPFIQRMSGLPSPAAPLEFLGFMSVRFWKALQVFSYGAVGIFGLIGAGALLAGHELKKRWLFEGAVLLLLTAGVGIIYPVFSFQILVTFLIYFWFKEPLLRWLVVWCGIAFGLYLVTYDMVSAYLQPFGVACALIFGAQFAKVTGTWPLGRSARRVLVYARVFPVAGALLGFLVVLGVRTFELPVLSGLYRPVARVRQVSYNLRNFIRYARDNIRDDTVVIVAPYHREEMADIYCAREMAGRGAYSGEYGGYLKAFGIRGEIITWSSRDKPPDIGKYYVVALDGPGFELVSSEWELEPEVVFGTQLDPAAIVKPFARRERRR